MYNVTLNSTMTNALISSTDSLEFSNETLTSSLEWLEERRKLSSMINHLEWMTFASLVLASINIALLLRTGFKEKTLKPLEALIKWVSPNEDSSKVSEFTKWFFSGKPENEDPHIVRIKDKLGAFLQILKKSNDNAKFVDENGKSILHYCISAMKDPATIDNFAKHCDEILVTNLCKAGASIIAIDCDGYTPIDIALEKERIDLVKVMLRDHPNPKERNIHGQTSLHVLLDTYSRPNNENYKKFHEYTTDLIKGGADFNETDKNGVRPAHLAAKALDINLLKIFEKLGAILHSRTRDWDDLLIIVCKNIVKETNEEKALDLIKWLLDRGFKANSKNKLKFSPLHYASRSDNLPVIKALVKAGADVHATANDNTNPLHSATTSSSFEVMQYFVDHKVDLNRRDRFYGFSLIHVAALSTNEKNLEWLVENSFDPNDIGNCDLTPIHLASAIGNAKIVKKLIEIGGNVHCRDNYYKYTPLHLASMRKQFTAIQKINSTRSHSEKDEDNSSLVRYCFNSFTWKEDQVVDYKATIVALLEAGAKINARDKDNRTPLYYLTQDSVCDIAKILLKAGARV